MSLLNKLIPITVLSAASLGICGSVRAAEACPGAVIKMIVPNPAGGVGDLLSRILGDKASADLGQPVVVENRAGGTTVIGTDAVAKAKPDGCTILSLTASGVVVTVLRDKMPYNLARDFAPIMGIGSFPMVLAVPVASKLNSFAELAAAAKLKEGITYASGGTGSMAHLAAARLLKELDGTGNHIPYKGNSDAIQGLLGNHVQLFFPSTAEALPLMKAGKIRLLGVTSDARLSTLPDVPTMKELGFAEFNPKLWYAFLAPANTPSSVIARQRDAFSKALVDPSVQERLATLGFTAEIKDAAAVSVLMKSEAVRWAKVIKDNDIKSAD